MIDSPPLNFEIGVMMVTEGLIEQNERRNRSRFSVNVPLTIFLGDRAVASYARDVSDRGVYFYLAVSDGEMIEGDFEFMLKLPPEVTFSSWCSIRCSARLVRKEFTTRDLTGIAAEILQYSILGEALPSA